MSSEDEAKPAQDPPVAQRTFTGSSEADSLWLEHLRWIGFQVMSQYDSGVQERSTLLGFTGVMFALLVPAALSASRVVSVGLMLASSLLVVAVVLLGFAAMPSTITRPSPAPHRDASRDWATPRGGKQSASGLAAMDMLSPADPEQSIIEGLARLHEKRSQLYRVALVIVVVAVIVAGVTLMIAVIGGE